MKRFLFLLTILFSLFFMTGCSNTPEEKVTPPTPSVTPSVSVKKLSPPTERIDTKKKYSAVLDTSAGKITISLYADKTPITVNNFVYLAKNNFYDNTVFHRTVSGFMIQGGDPNGDGTGSPGYRFDDEPFEGEYQRGTIAMANSGPDTNGSQFFIMHDDFLLEKNYVIFGKVIEGMDVVDKIATAPVTANAMGEKSKPVSPIEIKQVQVIEE
jgi:peptidylprolyl isomerase